MISIYTGSSPSDPRRTEEEGQAPPIRKQRKGRATDARRHMVEKPSLQDSDDLDGEDVEEDAFLMDPNESEDNSAFIREQRARRGCKRSRKSKLAKGEIFCIRIFLRIN